MSDYEEVIKLEESGQIPSPDKRWPEGIKHHPKSKRLFQFLMDYDFEQYQDCFCWKRGGDGDNGEILMYQLDAFFEMLDKKGESL